MNRGEQIAREIIKMDNKHTWKYLSSSSFSSSSKKKRNLLRQPIFQKNSSSGSFLPKQRNPFSENPFFRKTHPSVLPLFAFCPPKNEDPLLPKNLPTSFPFTCSLLLAQPICHHLNHHVHACSAPSKTGPHFRMKNIAFLRV